MQPALLLAPLVVLSLGLILFSLRDLVSRPDEGVAGGNRWVWGALILFGNITGSIVYLALGRREPRLKDE